jgi:D-arabinose 1-dehydrogenase-like Zn-dependent alcohol dehydrogenase
VRIIGGGGGLSEAVAVPWDAVLPLPENVDLDTGGPSSILDIKQTLTKPQH